MTDFIDFDPPEGDAHEEQADALVGKVASLNARAVMPNGAMLDRAGILEKLGLNPHTSPDAWLAVIGCGSNASALNASDLSRIAVDRTANAASVLKKVQALEGGFARGGKAPLDAE